MSSRKILGLVVSFNRPSQSYGLVEVVARERRFGFRSELYDLIDPPTLQGKPVVVAATGGRHRHALISAHQLRPLFGFFITHTLPSAIYASDCDFLIYRLSAERVLDRVGQAVSKLDAFFSRLCPIVSPSLPSERD